MRRLKRAIRGRMKTGNRVLAVEGRDDVRRLVGLLFKNELFLHFGIVEDLLPMADGNELFDLRSGLVHLVAHVLIEAKGEPALLSFHDRGIHL